MRCISANDCKWGEVRHYNSLFMWLYGSESVNGGGKWGEKPTVRNIGITELNVKMYWVNKLVGKWIGKGLWKKIDDISLITVNIKTNVPWRFWQQENKLGPSNHQHLILGENVEVLHSLGPLNFPETWNMVSNKNWYFHSGHVERVSTALLTSKLQHDFRVIIWKRNSFPYKYLSKLQSV